MANNEILIVEDNQKNMVLAKTTFELEGYHVHTAYNAEAALKILEVAQPSVILMDIQLPGMGGLELTKHIRSDNRFKDIVIIAVTAFAMNGDKEKILAAGCDYYVAKPADFFELSNLIKSYLTERQ